VKTEMTKIQEVRDRLEMVPMKKPHRSASGWRPLSGCAEPTTHDQIQSHFKSIKP
jgi:hypothetical protein